MTPDFVWGVLTIFSYDFTLYSSRLASQFVFLSRLEFFHVPRTDHGLQSFASVSFLHVSIFLRPVPFYVEAYIPTSLSLASIMSVIVSCVHTFSPPVCTNFSIRRLIWLHEFHYRYRRTSYIFTATLIMTIYR